MNTALYSFGGLSDSSGQTINDEKFLPIETRRLYEWIQNTEFEYRILAMHHPKFWLTKWAEEEVERIASHFDLILNGHIHTKDALHRHDGKNSVIECSAPALFTSKNNQLGYSIIHIDENLKSTSIQYRQWAGDCFVTGSLLSKTDDGFVRFGALNYVTQVTSDPFHESERIHNATTQYLQKNLDETLKCYSSVPIIWVTPIISDRAESSNDNKETVLQHADQFCTALADCIIKAPTQFGLSSLGRYFALKVWQINPGKYCVFVDSNQIQNHESAIRKSILDLLSERELTEDNLHAIILDERRHLNDRKINNIKKCFPGIPLIILLSIEYDDKIADPVDCEIDHEYAELYLWSLDRTQIRAFVRQFLNAGSILDEDAAIQHLVDDLANLNLHRTPLNCLTLLTIYDDQINYSPANRTEMLERFLYLIFSAYKKNPNYSNYPDMKDSLYVLGKFCEGIIRTESYQFSKQEFLSFSIEYCKKMVIDVDCSRLFEVMHNENIIVKRDDLFHFRYVSLIYFFSAHRMHHDAAFQDFILSNAHYVNYPEIIEFYSGIDRRREDLIEILTRDLRVLNESFESRTKITRDFNPYSYAKWSPSAKEITSMKSHVENEMKQTSLPKNVKDQIADNSYDRSRPYIQEIRTFIRDSSLHECSQMARAAARALRNSDYVDAAKKELLLQEIMRAWSKIIQVLVIISPMLAANRRANFENIGFYLDATFVEEDKEKLWNRIMNVIPWNVIGFYEKELASARMAPLLGKFLDESDNEIGRHIIAANLIRLKPSGGLTSVKRYIHTLAKDSFYLLEMFQEVSTQYRYGFYTAKQKSELEDLFGLALAKHQYGAKSPSGTLIKKAAKAAVKNLLGKSGADDKT